MVRVSAFCPDLHFAWFLDLDIWPRSIVVGNAVRAHVVRHRNHVTAKAWEKAVQEQNLEEEGYF